MSDTFERESVVYN